MPFFVLLWLHQRNKHVVLCLCDSTDWRKHKTVVSQTSRCTSTLFISISKSKDIMDIWCLKWMWVVYCSTSVTANAKDEWINMLADLIIEKFCVHKKCTSFSLLTTIITYLQQIYSIIEESVCVRYLLSWYKRYFWQSWLRFLQVHQKLIHRFFGLILFEYEDGHPIVHSPWIHTSFLRFQNFAGES